MDYLKHCIEVLELNKVLKQVSNFTCFAQTKNLILNLVPCTNLQIVREKLNETDEAMAFLERSEELQLFETQNPVQPLKRAKSGSFLNVSDLLNVGLILKQASSILNFYEKNKNFINFLKKYFIKIIKIDSLKNEIFRSIVSEEFIADEASENLKLIRNSIASKKKQIDNILQNFINNSDKKQYLQENIISIKNGRYVLAVKSQFANKIFGLVQEVSSSKATIFIEPMEIVDCCNELKILKTKEKAEIELILKNLSLNCLKYFNEIEQNYFTMLEFDFIFSKAKFNLKLNCKKPEIVKDGTINLVLARHPLIDSKKVIPINIKLGGEFKNLIISGPNTGGKTVSLKTIGLLSLMTMCGLLIPCAESSKISIFNKILISLGDEQSIENSLSTFSAHMNNLSKILSLVDNKSLVLIDELCNGTDPKQGSALAVSVVETLCDLKACFAITTHYMELKLFALKNNKFIENASFGFDETLLTPTYELKIGFFGQSNALHIAKKIGISNKIINRAENLIDDDRLKFDKVIEELNKLKLKYEKKLKFQQEELFQIKELKQNLENKQKQLNISEKEYLEKVRLKANETINSVRIKANSILNELKDIDKTIKTDGNIKKALEKAKSISKNSVQKLLKKFSFDVEKPQENIYTLPKKLQKGDRVLICNLEKKGIVLSEPDKNENVLVEIGNIKTRVALKQLQLIEDEQNVKTNLNVNRKIISKKLRKIVTSVDLRGQTSIDAIFMVDRAIDGCVLNNVSTLTIIHGKGTGVLRNVIFKHLKNHKNILSQRLGNYYEGGDGVTIVEIK